MVLRKYALVIWCKHTMMKIKWTNRGNNEEVLRGVGEKRTFLKTLKRSQNNLNAQFERPDSMIYT